MAITLPDARQLSDEVLERLYGKESRSSPVNSGNYCGAGIVRFDRYSESPEQYSHMTDIYLCFAGLIGAFIVTGVSAVVGEPSEGPFDHPALPDRHEPLGSRRAVPNL